MEFPDCLHLGLSFSVVNEGVGHFSSISRSTERVSLRVHTFHLVLFSLCNLVFVCSTAEPNASEQCDKRLTVVSPTAGAASRD